jgi:hypothetical protein
MQSRDRSAKAWNSFSLQSKSHPDEGLAGLGIALMVELKSGKIFI